MRGCCKSTLTYIRETNPYGNGGDSFPRGNILIFDAILPRPRSHLKCECLVCFIASHTLFINFDQNAHRAPDTATKIKRRFLWDSSGEHGSGVSLPNGETWYYRLFALPSKLTRSSIRSCIKLNIHGLS